MSSITLDGLQPTRIPTGGLKPQFSPRHQPRALASTHQNPDWGIETAVTAGTGKVTVAFNPPESRLGD